MSADHHITVHRSVGAFTQASATPVVPDESNPLRKYEARIVASGALGGGGSSDPTPRVPKPWVSFGSSSSVVLNWLPPGKRFDPLAAPKAYSIEQRVDGEAWCALSEAHTGSVPAHTVRGLRFGELYQFRVGTAVPSAADTLIAWSEASDPTRVGFADFTDVSPTSTLSQPASGANGFTAAELAFFSTLSTPALVQDYLDTIPMNHETEDDTCMSALESVRQNAAHCIEGAMLGAFILSLHGHPPMLVDLRASTRDDDHNVAVFQWAGRWGCLSVSNHSSLRWRNPIYNTVRELAMSYLPRLAPPRPASPAFRRWPSAVVICPCLCAD
jgi:hypothetical protein